MNKLLALLAITFSISCTGQNKPEAKADIVTLAHSPLDTAASFLRKDYTLYSYIPDKFPRNGGTEFWLVPKDSTDKFTINASNSMVIKSTEGIRVCVVPADDNFKLSIFKNDLLAEEISFNVIDFEEPKISVYSEQELAKNSLSHKKDSVLIKIEQPNLKYKRVYPKDCRYTSDSLVISVVRDGKTIGKFTTKEGKVSLLNFNLQKNDSFHIEAFNVQRKNFINQLFPVVHKLEADYQISQ
ncbi:hypothetical protein RCC89_12645 [Cytophagaceae bacterium ABcell3]|nr:hypothetical protein RCC89_12645 [Cytophagaceae bacterium ABcell3]